jgi:hypothetical protein
MSGAGGVRKPLPAYDPANLDERESQAFQSENARLTNDYLRATKLAAKLELAPELITIDECLELGQLRYELRRDHGLVVP